MLIHFLALFNRIEKNPLALLGYLDLAARQFSLFLPLPLEIERFSADNSILLQTKEKKISIKHVSNK